MLWEVVLEVYSRGQTRPTVDLKMQVSVRRGGGGGIQSQRPIEQLGHKSQINGL